MLRAAFINNVQTRPSVLSNGHVQALPGQRLPLPTSPAVVGSPLDWTRLNQETPGTHFLRQNLGRSRRMVSMPVRKLDEPNQNSVSTL